MSVAWGTIVSDPVAVMPVDDFDTACAWYQIFGGRPADLASRPGEAVWQIAGAGRIAVVADEARAGKALLTVLVDDLEQRVGFLAMRGIAPESIQASPGVARTATFLDPAGNTITIAERAA